MELTCARGLADRGPVEVEEEDWERASQQSFASTHCTGSLLDLVAEVEELLLHRPPSHSR